MSWVPRLLLRTGQRARRTVYLGIYLDQKLPTLLSPAIQRFPIQARRILVLHMYCIYVKQAFSDGDFMDSNSESLDSDGLSFS